MSFQDVGKSGTRSKASRPPTQPSIPERHSVQKNNNSAIFSQVSDGIVQYQRNVGILQKIAAQVGTKADGPTLETQYKVQVDVLKQLGDKLDQQLKTQEAQLESLPRAEAAKRRATHVKLTRDFRRVEGTFKSVVLETRRRRARLAEQAAAQRATEESGGALSDNSTTPDEYERRQLQLQQEKLDEEIMREREEEIRNINRGMHQVNEIYKDLAYYVEGQQEQIDQIETQMDESRANAEAGLKHVTKANERASQSNCTIS